MNREEIENRIEICERRVNTYNEVGNTKNVHKYENEKYKWEKLLSDLDPVTIIEFKNYLLEKCSTKNSNSKIIFKFRTKEKCCNKRGCILHKNGVQKYICSGCKITSSETTNTIVCHSKLPFKTWSNIIDNLLNGFSLRRIA